MTLNPSLLDHERLAQRLLAAVLEAGRITLAHRQRGVAIEQKGDGSPVTLADREAEAVLLAVIAEALPGVRVLSEEAESAGGQPEGVDAAGLLVMVDPLDGTREYIKGGEDFTVNVGVASDGRPAFGMILQPTSGRLFVTMGPAQVIEADATAALQGSTAALHDLPQRPIMTRQPDPKALRALASLSHDSPATSQFLARFAIGEIGRLGSSLKLCLLAAGEADLYPRFGPTCVWDTCAGHAILVAAGGSVTTTSGEELCYTRLEPPYLNPDFVAWGRRQTADLARK